MNRFLVRVIEIEFLDNLNIVTYDFQGTILKMMGLELDSRVTIGSELILSVKPTSLALFRNSTKDFTSSNEIEMQVHSINRGKLLSSVKLFKKETMIEAIVLSNSLDTLCIEKESKAYVVINPSDLFIVEVLPC